VTKEISKWVNQQAAQQVRLYTPGQSVAANDAYISYVLPNAASGGVIRVISRDQQGGRTKVRSNFGPIWDLKFCSCLETRCAHTASCVSHVTTDLYPTCLVLLFEQGGFTWLACTIRCSAPAASCAAVAVRLSDCVLHAGLEA